MDKISVGKENLVDLLDFCQGAIQDAIECEEGLDGAAGQAVLDMIKDWKKQNGISLE